MSQYWSHRGTVGAWMCLQVIVPSDTSMVSKVCSADFMGDCHAADLHAAVPRIYDPVAGTARRAAVAAAAVDG